MGYNLILKIYKPYFPLSNVLGLFFFPVTSFLLGPFVGEKQTLWEWLHQTN